jgi:hypothetical protein
MCAKGLGIFEEFLPLFFVEIEVFFDVCQGFAKMRQGLGEGVAGEGGSVAEEGPVPLSIVGMAFGGDGEECFGADEGPGGDGVLFGGVDEGDGVDGAVGEGGAEPVGGGLEGEVGGRGRGLGGGFGGEFWVEGDLPGDGEREWGRGGEEVGFEGEEEVGRSFKFRVSSFKKGVGGKEEDGAGGGGEGAGAEGAVEGGGGEGGFEGEGLGEAGGEEEGDVVFVGELGEGVKVGRGRVLRTAC